MGQTDRQTESYGRGQRNKDMSVHQQQSNQGSFTPDPAPYDAVQRSTAPDPV